MTEGLFFLFLFNFIPISAQYCCTEIGKVLHYTTIDKKQEKTLKDSALVRDVIHENERIVVDLRWYGDSYSPTQIIDGTNRETFIPQKDRHHRIHRTGCRGREYRGKTGLPFQVPSKRPFQSRKGV